MNTLGFRATVLFSLAISSTGYGLTFLNNCELSLKNLEKTPSALRSLASIESLKIISYNLRDFKVPAENRPSQGPDRRERKDKDPELVRLQKKLIESWDADILTVEEVYDEISLNALGSERYVPIFIEGNDDQNHIGFLVKKDLPFYVSIETHENEMWFDKSYNGKKKLFSRDLPALLIRASPESDPVHILFGNHGKAPRDRKGDRESWYLRRAQYRRAAQIISGYKKKYPGAGILLAGDFNADIRTVSVVDPIKASLVDPFELKQIPWADRVTHIFFPRVGALEKTQMDNIFVSPNLTRQILSVRVIPYLDGSGHLKPEPKSYAERETNGSDHEAVELVISTRAQ